MKDVSLSAVIRLNSKQNIQVQMGYICECWRQICWKTLLSSCLLANFPEATDCLLLSVENVGVRSGAFI